MKIESNDFAGRFICFTITTLFVLVILTVVLSIGFMVYSAIHVHP